MKTRLSTLLPVLQWAPAYNRQTLMQDALAAVIVTFLLIPQSLAYAQLAGLPPEAGLYASIAPLVIYALLGSSRVLAVGPVAVASLMTATAISQFATPGTDEYWQAAVILATLSGLIMLLMGILKLGFLANFLSHPVISGFISASALLIAFSQLKTIIVPDISTDQLWAALQHPDSLSLHWPTLLIGAATLLFLYLCRQYMAPLMMKLGLNSMAAQMTARTSPVLVIIVTIVLSWQFQWQTQGVAVVGSIPQGMPPFALPQWDSTLWQQLLLPALLISIVGFVESVSVGQTLAAKRRQRIEPNQELIAIGGSNLSAAFNAGFPVTGGFSRSVVNFDAGAQTPAAGVLTAGGILLAALFLTPVLYYLPTAVLAATIIIAVLSLVDWHIFKKTWYFSKSDFAAVSITFGTTLIAGVEAGLISGVTTSLILFIKRTSQPHIAETGRIPGTEHFRNTQRHQVITCPDILSLRIDESLYFANARALEDYINQSVARHPSVHHLIIQCSAVNDIDASALDSLQQINQRLQQAGIKLHLSEIKGPVMDKLKHSEFYTNLSGQYFMTHYQGIEQLKSSQHQPA